MALQDILSTISAKAQEEIKKIEQETTDALARIKEETQREIAKIEQEHQAKARALADEALRRTRMHARAEIKSAVLRKKRQVLDAFFENVKQKLKELDEQQKTSLFQKLAKTLPASLHNATIITSPSDEKILKHALSHAGLAYQIEVRETAQPGFVLLSPNVEISHTYEEIIKRMREDIETDVAKILFEHEKN